MIEITSLNELTSHLKRLTKGKLWLQVIMALLLGAGVGIILNPSIGVVTESFSDWFANWLDLPGKIFLRLVQMVMIPLIFASIISGIISNNPQQLKTMGLRLFLYFVFTTAVAIIIGAVLTMFMKPGALVNELGGLPGVKGEKMVANGSLSDFQNVPQTISNLIPDNPLESILLGEMLGVVIFTIIIGVAITQLEENIALPIIRMIEAIQKICMIVVSWAMLLVPIAVFGLIAALLSDLGVEVLLGLGYYMVVVLLGLALLLVFYMMILMIVGKKNPKHFLKAAREPQLLAFSTASSAAVMPLSMKVADEQLNVSSNISDFVIPVGASINMDGTALFQCTSALFIAQAYGIELSLINLLLITITIVGASIGTPAIPGGGVIILASVLQSSGIPTEGLIVIIGIDRILGMFRTTVNVTGDLVACVIFDRWFGNNKRGKVRKTDL
ncbi:dicarboxylate/amino acid:cation symporter [Aquimarina gracilis]|uniref:Dicarboxylate/amino acid:cation symporter n=1 Tax=Aquimarina gracilis TaxID=874422 RepID=A0ABU5ZSF2_9FLAO|nr:dicarboxylate/amino acid:cation symporter [Aquimarina gracilis]MEB3344935.1 dicarboxylate/amino acid:cation symporter [Aquimarina gracilis]